MRRLATLAVVVVAILMWPTAASGYTFGDWARDNGYNPGDAMPYKVTATYSAIDSLNGIDEFDWTSVPTTELRLEYNQISSIESGTFDGLTNLTVLNLDHNQISTVEPGDFDGLTNLTTLWLGGNRISSIESGGFSGLANLTGIILWLNQISSIESGDFSGLTNLTSLILGGNQISSIESGAFSGMTNLEYLHLSGNQLSSIESGAFSGLTNLEYLSLAGNQLSSVESGVFSELANLLKLRLYDNVTLTELNLAKADFSSLNDFDVEGSVNITSVSLRSTVLNQVSLAALLDGGLDYHDPTGIGELDGITEMDLSGVDFADITDLEPLYVMDDLTDLWLVNTLNLDATDLDLLLDNLETIEGTSTEGMLHMTQANFDTFNTAGGGLLVAWDAEPGHHVEFFFFGDMDADGDVDFDDIAAFVLGLRDPGLYEDLYGVPPELRGDLDMDGDFDFDDIPGFVAGFRSPLTGETRNTPEPATAILTAIGLLGVAVCGWRHRENLK